MQPLLQTRHAFLQRSTLTLGDVGIKSFSGLIFGEIKTTTMDVLITLNGITILLRFEEIMRESNMNYLYQKNL